jgi:hypothetical protein
MLEAVVSNRLMAVPLMLMIVPLMLMIVPLRLEKRVQSAKGMAGRMVITSADRECRAAVRMPTKEPGRSTAFLVRATASTQGVIPDGE